MENRSNSLDRDLSSHYHTISSIWKTINANRAHSGQNIGNDPNTCAIIGFYTITNIA
ncbi:MAG: hypothetical protein H6582_12230 [Crocinitomicaceae bacterium]|nr:hypothetical protein [Crocinitomicaceae bacterium]